MKKQSPLGKMGSYPVQPWSVHTSVGHECHCTYIGESRKSLCTHWWVRGGGVGELKVWNYTSDQKKNIEKQKSVQIIVYTLIFWIIIIIIIIIIILFSLKHSITKTMIILKSRRMPVLYSISIENVELMPFPMRNRTSRIK